MLFALVSFDLNVICFGFCSANKNLTCIFCLKYNLLNSNFFIKLLYKCNICTAVIYLCLTQLTILAKIHNTYIIIEK